MRILSQEAKHIALCAPYDELIEQHNSSIPNTSAITGADKIYLWVQYKQQYFSQQHYPEDNQDLKKSCKINIELTEEPSAVATTSLVLVIHNWPNCTAHSFWNNGYILPLPTTLPNEALPFYLLNLSSQACKSMYKKKVSAVLAMSIIITYW